MAQALGAHLVWPADGYAHRKLEIDPVPRFEQVLAQVPRAHAELLQAAEVVRHATQELHRLRIHRWCRRSLLSNGGAAGCEHEHEQASEGQPSNIESVFHGSSLSGTEAVPVAAPPP